MRILILWIPTVTANLLAIYAEVLTATVSVFKATKCLIVSERSYEFEIPRFVYRTETDVFYSQVSTNSYFFTEYLLNTGAK